MKITNINLNELRKEYAKPPFAIRIRENKKEENKKEENKKEKNKKVDNNIKDIVYYNGIRAFYIENANCTKDYAIINIPDNIYKLNKTNLEKSLNNKMGYNLQYKKQYERLF